MNATDTKMVKSPNMAQGIVSNTHYEEKCILKNCTHDRMSSRKVKRMTSGAKKAKFVDKKNLANVRLLPAETEADGWVSTLAPLTLLNTIKGQTLDILWVFGHKFSPLPFPDTVSGRKSSQMMASSRSGFFFFPFDHYDLLGYCLQTVIQLLAETYGPRHIISWVFF